MTLRVSLFASILICYLLGWLVSFLSTVGFAPSLIVSYFTSGWRFDGLEKVTFVWLFAWPIFAIVLLSLLLLRWRFKR